METPEKIYLTSDENNSYIFTQKRSDNMGVEYARTDAFIEKAKKWLEKNADNYIWSSDYAENPGDDICGMDDDFVDDFVNYMKGE